MKIAQVAPLSESCPPRLYGGTERVVANLCDQLVRQGHEVTLFASGDSQTLAELDPACERALRLSPGIREPRAYETIQLGRVVRRAPEFDVLHFHLDYHHFPAVIPFGDRVLTTLHGRLDLPDLPPVFREFPSMALVSISDSQRRPLANANWIGTVHHGIPPAAYELGSGGGDYLAFLGRISPEKGIERAVEIAVGAKRRLRVAAKIDRVDRAYFETIVAPLFASPLVETIGEIGEREKSGFLGNARALIFPITWPEPFGLVMIEAMACGTPVIAWRNGSVPEVIEHGVTGFIIDSIEEGIEAVERVKGLDRAKIRRRFEQRFSVERMANDYVSLYEAIRSRSVVTTASRIVA
jgi:glycosyltransferase involved in cell wall biosynthesis